MVISTCLTVAAALGGLMNQLCIVGGLVPLLLFDHQLDISDDDPHCGTNDLDVALAVALLADEQYAEISSRLRQEDFGPDTNKAGNKTLQRWKHRRINVTIDFLLPAPPEAERSRRVQPLESDFGALLSQGLGVAFDEQHTVELEGQTLAGEKLSRQIRVCGPGAFVVLKALAFADRAEPKDAYDLIYTLRRWQDGVDDLAARIGDLSAGHAKAVGDAINALANDFANPDRIGPLRAAEFNAIGDGNLDNDAADAQGFVDDFLRAYRANNKVGV